MILLNSSLESFFQLVGVLLIFIFVLVVTYVTTRWIGGYQKLQMSGREFKVVDTVRIANGRFVQILKLGEVYLVVAVGKDEVTMLAKLTEEEIGLTVDEITGAFQTKGTDKVKVQESFQEMLEGFREHFSKKQD